MALYVGNTRYTPMLGNSRASFMVEDALPYDAEIEYLESTGTQYIDTGVDLKKMMVAKYRIEFTSVSGIQVIFGVYTNNANISRGQLYINGVAWRDNSANNMRSSGWTGNAAIGTIYDITSYNPNINTSDYTMYIFARNTDTNSPIPTKMRLYRMTMTQDGLLVRDFIPVRKGSVGYLYDRVSKQLFGNSGSGDFVLGQDIVEVEYLESSGAQWIDTSVNLREIVSMKADITITKNIATASDVFGAFYDNAAAPRLHLYINGSMKWSNPDRTKYSYSGITAGGSVSLNTHYNPIITTVAAQASDATVWVFARNNDHGDYIPIDGMRLYSCQITRGGVVVRDFVPVRVGTTGYLLDKAEHKLYGNAGTGSFVFGNDKN